MYCSVFLLVTFENNCFQAIKRHRVTSSGPNSMEQTLMYWKLLQLAKKEDFSRYSSLRCLYRSGQGDTLRDERNIKEQEKEQRGQNKKKT